MKKLLAFLLITFHVNLLAFSLAPYFNIWAVDLMLLAIHLAAVLHVGEKLPSPDSPALEILTDTWPIGATLGLITTCVLSSLGYPLRTYSAASGLCIIGIWLLVYGAYRVVYHYTSRIRPW